MNTNTPAGTWATIYWNDDPQKTELTRYFSFTTLDEQTDDQIFYHCENENEFLEMVKNGGNEFTILNQETD